MASVGGGQVTGYNVKRARLQAVHYADRHSGQPNLHRHRQLSRGTRYYYVVHATGSGGESGQVTRRLVSYLFGAAGSTGLSATVNSMASRDSALKWLKENGYYQLSNGSWHHSRQGSGESSDVLAQYMDSYAHRPEPAGG